MDSYLAMVIRWRQISDASVTRWRMVGRLLVTLWRLADINWSLVGRGWDDYQSVTFAGQSLMEGLLCDVAARYRQLWKCKHHITPILALT